MINTGTFGMAGIGLTLLLSATPIAAQEARDPTVAPAESATTMQSPAGVEGMSVLIRDDKPYLVVGTRLYAPGDRVGNLRVERITETEIWLHDGNALIKTPRFTGVGRKVVTTKPACADVSPAPRAEPTSAPQMDKARKSNKRARPGPSAPASNPLPAVAPCEDTPS